MPTAAEARNMELMRTLDDARNAQDVEVFRARRKPDVIGRWPGQPDPTVGIDDHAAESIRFWKPFPDQKLDHRPYRVFFASGDWTCSIARFRGTMKGPMFVGGKEIPPTGKSFEVDFSTVARWSDGQLVEENLIYDLVGFLQQKGHWSAGRPASGWRVTPPQLGGGTAWPHRPVPPGGSQARLRRRRLTGRPVAATDQPLGSPCLANGMAAHPPARSRWLTRASPEPRPWIEGGRRRLRTPRPGRCRVPPASHPRASRR